MLLLTSQALLVFNRGNSSDRVAHQEASHTREASHFDYSLLPTLIESLRMPKTGAEQEARIKQALEDLETGKIRYIREASRVHDVPYSTLAARRTGRPSRYTAHTQQQTCTEVEEQSLNN